MSTCLHDEFERVAAARPDAPALVWHRQTLSYGELNQRANLLAAALRRRGVGPGALVGLCLERSPSQVIAILATLKAGGAYLPIDPGHPQERIAFMIDDARPRVMVTEERVLSALGLDWPDALRLDADAGEIARGGEWSGSAGPDDLAYAIYTSGSTGRPKGVLVTHRNVTRLFAASRDWFGFDAGATWTQLHSYGFGYSVWEIWGALLHGARLVLVPAEVAASPRLLRELLSREQVTVLSQTPSAFGQVLLGDGFGEAPLIPSLRWVLLSGEKVVPADAARFLARYGDEQPRLASLYALTEAGGEVGYLRLTRERVAANGATTVGELWPDMQVRLLDEAGRAATEGELYVGGAGLARGYLNRPELTAERFVTIGGERLYRTGDRARRSAGGELEILGRTDDQVKVRGVRVELGEVEAALRESPPVHEAAAALRAGQLIGYFVSDDELDGAALRAQLAARLPEAMIPSRLVRLPRLPLNASGKLDRAALPDPPAERSSDFAPPRNPAERRLQNLWSRTLRLPVGVHDNFFDLGGHSIQAVELFAQIRREFGVDLPLATLTGAPTVARLAALLAHKQGRRGSTVLVPIRATGGRVPFFCVHGAGGYTITFELLARHLHAEQPFYGLQAIGLEGDEPPLDDIHTMAQRYLGEIASVRPRGPYLLGGMGLGGVIALEMAQELRARGEEVAQLILIDPSWHRLTIRERVAAALSLVKAGRPDRGFQLLTARLRNELKWWLRSRRDTKFFLSNRVRKAAVRAMLRYRMRPYHGPITLIRSQFTDELGASFDEVWRGIGKGGLGVHTIEVDRQCIFARPEEVAAIIQATLAG